jgi:hypothetical protein
MAIAYKGFLRATFNVSEWGGNALAAAISNAYYPDTRDAKDNPTKLLIACGTDTFSNVLKEFRPDVTKKLHRSHAPENDSPQLDTTSKSSHCVNSLPPAVATTPNTYWPGVAAASNW